MLIITLQEAGAQAFAIRLLPTVKAGTFPLAKLAPQRNNLRGAAPAALTGKAAAAQEEAHLPATPFYNAAIIQVGVSLRGIMEIVQYTCLLSCMPELHKAPSIHI